MVAGLRIERVVRKIDRFAAEIHQSQTSRKRGDIRRTAAEEVGGAAAAGCRLSGDHVVRQREEEPEEERLRLFLGSSLSLVLLFLFIRADELESRHRGFVGGARTEGTARAINDAASSGWI